ncbi:SH3 domain-containing protein [Clostridium bornimense]|uniref:SH3 domain-containing protein n=1 Tax=Clostridium bornimense TaxID=1216932 RepID=UPI001C10DDC6|nr:SH3 domain-containing protein [Clostridium bornimense]MBU5317855.1 SH3 domain-containing protein [Clostridium bornimense]
MNLKRMIELTVISILLMVGTLTTNVKANESTVVNKSSVEERVITPRIAGIFKVTSLSGAYVRLGPGTDNPTIVKVWYGEELNYCGESKKEFSGVVWYKVQAHGKIGWISSNDGWLG